MNFHGHKSVNKGIYQGSSIAEHCWEDEESLWGLKQGSELEWGNIGSNEVC